MGCFSECSNQQPYEFGCVMPVDYFIYVTGASPGWMRKIIGPRGKLNIKRP
jgi:hypothetical protein